MHEALDRESSRVSEVDEAFLDKVASRLGFPVFVKPTNMGSSVGVSMAQDTDELRTAVAEAGRLDD